MSSFDSHTNFDRKSKDKHQNLPPWFSHTDIHSIHTKLIRSGVQITGLIGGMNLLYKAQLPTSGPPGPQLLSVLRMLNDTDWLVDGELPIETFLQNAIHMLEPRRESAEIDIYLQELRRKIDRNL